jgi:hypothetical protein
MRTHAQPVLEREVSASAAEFAHGLRNAFPTTLMGGPLLFRARGMGAALEIELMPGDARRIGGLTLPTLAVRIRFNDGDEQAQAALLAHMDRIMQRGGG